MALSGAVIVAVYVAGYSRTEAAAQAQAAAGASLSHAAPGGAGGTAGSGTNASGAASGSAAAPAGGTSTGAKAAAKWKDGTYSAQGMGPHGPVTVSVIIRAGRIVSANITACGTTYPCSYLQPLINLVVSSQSAPADYISGATASSYAYYEAVTQALAQA